jgi:ATP-binding protein involved in chromosome partitioning
MTSSLLEPIQAALATVNDPEIHRPITELGMVKDIDVSPDGVATVTILLTVAGCPMKETLTRDVTAAVGRVPGVSRVAVVLDVMSTEQRQQLQTTLRGGAPAKEIPFARPDSLTQVIAVASGKGGVGKSSVTVNLAMAMVRSGR